MAWRAIRAMSAVAVSAGLHAALAGAVWLAVRPAPPAPEAMPRAAIEIASQAVAQSTADAVPAQGDTLQDVAPAGLPSAGRTIPQGRAVPLATDAERRASVAPAAQRVGTAQRERAVAGAVPSGGRAVGAMADDGAPAAAVAPDGAAPKPPVWPAALTLRASAPVPGDVPALPSATGTGTALHQAVPAPTIAAPLPPDAAAAAPLRAADAGAATVGPLSPDPAMVAAQVGDTVAAALSAVRPAVPAAAVPLSARIVSASTSGPLPVAPSVAATAPTAAPEPLFARRTMPTDVDVAAVVAMSMTAPPGVEVAVPPRPAPQVPPPAVAALGGIDPVASAAVPVAAPATATADVDTDLPAAKAIASAGAFAAVADARPIRVAPGAPAGDAAAALAPPADRRQAALAWSGAGRDEVDPLSLAAISAFMRPEAGAGSGREVRDDLESALATVPCARIQTVFRPETGRIELRGHVPDDGMRPQLLAALRRGVGGSIPVDDAMRLLPRPLCGVLSAIDAVGLAQSTDQATNPRVVGADSHARVYSYRGGDALRLDLIAPDYPAFLYVDYFDAGGNVLHLQPNETVPARRITPATVLRIGTPADGAPALDLTVGPPYGQEIVAAFAASRPLYAKPRPMIEPAAPYLDFLLRQVAAARAADPGFRGEWVYFLVETHAR